MNQLAVGALHLAGGSQVASPSSRLPVMQVDAIRQGSAAPPVLSLRVGTESAFEVFGPCAPPSAKILIRRASAASVGLLSATRHEECGSLNTRIPTDARQLRNELAQEAPVACLQDPRAIELKPADVAARPRQARHDAAADWIAHRHHHQRNRSGRALDRKSGRRTGGDDHLDLPRSGVFGDEFGESNMFLFAVCPAIFDLDANGLLHSRARANRRGTGRRDWPPSSAVELPMKPTR